MARFTHVSDACCLEVQSLEGSRVFELAVWSLWSCSLQGRARFPPYGSVLCGGFLSPRDIWRRTGEV